MATDDRLEFRLGALRLARRRGNLRDGAWAAARLRLPGVKLDPADARFARDIFLRYGRAVRLASRPRVDTPSDASIMAGVALRPTRRRRLLAALAAAALIVLVLLIGEPALDPTEEPGGGSPAAAGVPAPTLPPLRGRSQNLIAAVPVATPEPTPAPTEAPTATPAPTAAPTGRPGVSGGGTGTGGAGGGSGGGTGGGIGPGSGAGTPTPAPTLAPTPRPTVDPFTTMILRGRVVDARTGKGIPFTCVAPGLNTCSGDTVTYTDTGGYWQLVLSIGQQWDIKFLKAAYYVSEIKVPSQAGIHYVPDIYLRPR